MSLLTTDLIRLPCFLPRKLRPGEANCPHLFRKFVTELNCACGFDCTMTVLDRTASPESFHVFVSFITYLLLDVGEHALSQGPSQAQRGHVLDHSAPSSLFWTLPGSEAIAGLGFQAVCCSGKTVMRTPADRPR